MKSIMKIKYMSSFDLEAGHSLIGSKDRKFQNGMKKGKG